MAGALSGKEGQGVGEQVGFFAQGAQVLVGKQEGSGMMVAVGCGLGAERTWEAAGEEVGED
jgi:hypothetical protein